MFRCVDHLYVELSSGVSRFAQVPEAVSMLSNSKTPRVLEVIKVRPTPGIMSTMNSIIAFSTANASLRWPSL